MQKFILLLILGIFSFQANSQNTGFLGRHVILKTDVLNGKRLGFQNADLEVVTSRQMSLTASFRRFAYAGTSGPKETKLDNRVEFQVYQPGTYYPEINYSSPGYYTDQYFDVFKTVFPGETKGWVASVGAKHFFYGILPAPLGFYSSYELGFGQAELTYTYETRYQPWLNGPRYGSPFSEGKNEITTKCNIYYFTLPSIGFQNIYLDRIVTDIKFQIEGYKNDIPKSLLNEYPYPYFSTNLGSARAGSLVMGPAIYGKVGLLLF